MMSLRSISLAVGLLATLASCNQQEAGQPVIRQDISGDVVQDITAPGSNPDRPKSSPSPAFASACNPHHFEDMLFTDCVAVPDKHRIEMDLGPESGTPYRSFKSFSDTLGTAKSHIAFAVNGGMYDGEGKPIGYYVEAGKRIKELNRANGEGNFHMMPNGVFFGGTDGWRILTTERFYSTVRDRPSFGTQSGPMLVIDGKLHPDFQDDGPSRTVRNGVGIDSQGRAHFVISEGPVSFGKLARFYRDELKVDNALYLDGNVSALWDPAKDRMDSGAPIGPLTVVTRKQP